MRALLLNHGLVLLVALVGAGCGDGPEPVPCCGQDVETPEEGILEPGQPVVADPTRRADYLLDFGSTAVGEIARRIFPVHNAGKLPLEFSAGNPAAPFTIAEQPTEIAAGATAALRVDFEPTQEGPAEAIVELKGADRTFSVRFVGAGAIPALDCPATVTMHGVRGGVVISEIRCTNPTEAGFDVEAESTPPFVVLAGPRWVDPGGELILGVVGNTAVAGRSTGILEITASTGAVAEVALGLVVKEGPRIRCDDGPVDFGEQVVGMRVPSRRITCHNEGDVTAGPLELTGSNPAFTAALPSDAVSPGESFDLEIGFAPPGAGQHAAEFLISAAPDGPATQVRAVASAIALAPCTLTAFPADGALDFFHVQVGSRSTRDLVLRNGGGEACAIRDISIVGPGDVWSVAMETPSVMLDAWAELRIPVVFEPDRSGGSVAWLEYRVSDPAFENRAIPLTGHAVDDCLVIPEDVLLSSNAPFCEVWTETVEVRNDCAEPVVFEGATALATGDQTSGFRVVEQPATPTTVAPGASIDLEMAFLGSSLGRWIHGGFVLDFEGRGSRWLQATVGPEDSALRSETFLIGYPPTDTLMLQRQPVLSDAVANLSEDFVVEVDGSRIGPVYQGVEVWTYDAAQNAIVLNEYFLPTPGSTVKIWYLPSCL